MNEQETVVTEPLIEAVPAAPKKSAYPKTMTRGPLAGRTFQTDGEYKQAMREAHKNGVPKRGYKAKNKATKAKVKAERGGSYRLLVKLNGQQIVAEGPMTQKQLVDLMLLLAPKA